MTAVLPPLDPHGILPRLQAGEPVKLLRQSNIGSSDICLRRAGYDMRPNGARHSGEARCVGTSYHAGLEWFYRCQIKTSRGEDPFPPTLGECVASAYEAFQAEAALFDSWTTSAAEAWQRVQDLLARYFELRCPWPQDHDVLGVEQEWFMPMVGDWNLKGSIDLVVRRPDGHVVLVDHKTAGRKWDRNKHKPEKQTQAVLYCWAWWRATGELPSFAFDVMTYKGEFDRRECIVEPRHIQAVMAKAIGTTMILDAVPLEWLPTNTSTALCSAVYCDYWAECPSGLALAPFIDPTPVSPAGGDSQSGAPTATEADEEASQ